MAPCCRGTHQGAPPRSGRRPFDRADRSPGPARVTERGLLRSEIGRRRDRRQDRAHPGFAFGSAPNFIFPDGLGDLLAVRKYPAFEKSVAVGPHRQAVQMVSPERVAPRDGHVL
jgi:hypothetical protein